MTWKLTRIYISLCICSLKTDIIIINRELWTGPDRIVKMERKIHGILAYLILRFSTYIMFV